MCDSEGGHCLHCREVFVKKSKGYKRKSLTALLKNSNISIKSFLETLVCGSSAEFFHNYVCDVCWLMLSRVNTLQESLRSAHADFWKRGSVPGNDHSYHCSDPTPKRPRIGSPYRIAVSSCNPKKGSKVIKCIELRCVV